MGLPRLPLAEPGREAVLSGVGLQVESLDSSSEDVLSSPCFFPTAVLLLLLPEGPELVALALAARSCLRNFARLF